MNNVTQKESLITVGDSARSRITRRLGPFLFILYVLNYLARVNLSYASLQMTGDLHFSNKIFSGFGAGIFFIGYFLLQVPQTLLVEMWSARKFIGVTLICWGALATLTGFIHNAQQVLLDPVSFGSVLKPGFFRE